MIAKIVPIFEVGNYNAGVVEGRSSFYLDRSDAQLQATYSYRDDGRVLSHSAVEFAEKYYLLKHDRPIELSSLQPRPALQKQALSKLTKEEREALGYS